jgi:hypothetical protein
MGDRQREEFAERVRRQVASRYLDTEIAIDARGFAIRLTAPGVDVSLPLTPLFHECQRRASETPSLISAFVREIESRLNPARETALSPSGLLWCVRTDTYLAESARSGELITREVAGDLVAFVARPIPVNAMRGVAAHELDAAGLDREAVTAAAQANTARRFESLLERIQNIDRVPGDGWRISVDELFCGSALLVPEVRRALVEKAQGEVLLAVPDRSVVLVLPVSAKSAPRFQMRATREWREAMNPCSRQVLRSDGESILASPPEVKPRGVLSWLAG